MSHSGCPASCCCETEKVCRLKVERSAKIGNNLSVGGNTITEGSLLPHRYVRVGLSANQAVAANATPVVEFTRPIASNELLYTTAPGQGVNGFTVPQTGIYGFKTSLFWEGNDDPSARSVGMQIRKANTVAVVLLHITNNANYVVGGGGGFSGSSDSAIYFLNAGDFVQIVASQNSTTAPLLNILFADPESFLEITQLR
jgi:hypothetical protein